MEEFLEDEEEDDSHESIVRSSLNPLEMSHLLAKISTYLDVTTLKEVRQVSSTWKIEGGKEMLKRSYIRSPSNNNNANQTEILEALDELLKSSGTLPFLSLRLVLLLPAPGNDGGGIDRLRDVPGLFDRVRELKFEGSCTHFLSSILSALPNLEVLDTNCLDLSGIWETSDNKLENLLSKLESLKEIRLNFYLTPSLLTNLQRHHRRLQGVQALKVKGNDIQQIMQIYQRQNNTFNNSSSSSSSSSVTNDSQYSSLSSFWKILRLEINYLDNGNPNVEVTRGFLHLLSETLEHLRLSVSIGTPRGGMEALEGSVFLPMSLKRLRSLEVKVFAKVHRAHEPWSLILFPALQLPNLKKITIGGGGPIWINNRQLSSMTSMSLQEINMYHNSSTPSALAFVTPNLKRLKLNLNLCDVEARTLLTRIFSDLTKLESLDLQLNYNELLNLDEVFNCSKKTLKNLQNLKKLVIRSWCSRKKFCLSDRFLSNDLIHMRKLQMLDIEGHNFSKEAVVHLKETLNSHAFFRFDNIQRATIDPFYLTWPGL